MDTELARFAARLREEGKSFQEIAEMLGTSKGQAHHLAKRGKIEFEHDAFMLARPPRREEPRTPQRAQELIATLQDDVGRVVGVIGNHRFLTDADIAEPLAAFHEGVSELHSATYLDEIPAEQIDGLGDVIAAVQRAFCRLLGVAAQCDPTVAGCVDRDHLLGPFTHDLLEVAKTLDPSTPDPSAWLDPRALGEIADHFSAQLPAPDKAPMTTAQDRQDRDHRIVQAMLRQVPTKKIAKTFGISERQVRRITSAWRAADHPPDDGAMAELMAQFARLGDDLDQFAAEDDPTTTTRLSILRERIALMQDVGMLSPEAFASGREHPVDWAPRVNLALRALLLEELGAEEGLVSAVMDEVLEVAGLGDI